MSNKSSFRDFLDSWFLAWGLTRKGSCWAKRRCETRASAAWDPLLISLGRAPHFNNDSRFRLTGIFLTILLATRSIQHSKLRTKTNLNTRPARTRLAHHS